MCFYPEIQMEQKSSGSLKLERNLGYCGHCIICVSLVQTNILTRLSEIV